jgi:Coenzyme PQQ synthesis protein D (PqqD)
MEAIFMNATNIISRSDGWLTAWIGHELVMMNAESNSYLSLSGSGGRIWELLEEPRTVGQLCQSLVGEFDGAPERIYRELFAFLDKLQLEHAIQVHSPILA